jgi:hypothetical protein
MKPLITTLFAGIVGLTLASAPLTAGAADWNGGHDRGGDRGGYRANDGDHGGDHDRDWGRRGDYDGGYAPPVYRAPYVNGSFGWAPGGFQGWYSNGGWFQHRRWRDGIWIYF